MILQEPQRHSLTQLDNWTLCTRNALLNGFFSVKLGDFQAAADSFEKSLELARRQNDTAAEDAIRRALNEVNEKIVKGVKEGDGDGKRLCSFHFLSVSTPSKREISNVHEIKNDRKLCKSPFEY